MGKAQGEVQPQGDKMFKNKKESQPKVVNQGYKIKFFFRKLFKTCEKKTTAKDMTSEKDLHEVKVHMMQKT